MDYNFSTKLVNCRKVAKFVMLKMQYIKILYHYVALRFVILHGDIPVPFSEGYTASCVAGAEIPICLRVISSHLNIKDTVKDNEQEK